MQTKAKTNTTTKRNTTTAKAKPQTKAAKAPKQTSADKAEQRAAFAQAVAAERAEAARIFHAADKASVSIPVKSMRAFAKTYRRDVAAHAIGRKPSPRQAAALAVACLSNGTKLADGATFARQFDRNGARYGIENGALSDAIASGLATYDGNTDTVTIANAAEIAAQIGSFALPS